MHNSGRRLCQVSRPCATFQDVYKNYWHVSAMVINVKNSFERRLGIWPAGFDKDGVMWCNTAFGNYPHKLPSSSNSSESAINSSGPADSFSLPGSSGATPLWMLLNYKKPVSVSSTFGSYHANNAVDENIKTYWSAATANEGEFIQSDLGNTSTINAIQINYADEDVDSAFLGKFLDIYHQYKLYYSVDGKK